MTISAAPSPSRSPVSAISPSALLPKAAGGALTLVDEDMDQSHVLSLGRQTSRSDLPSPSMSFSAGGETSTCAGSPMVLTPLLVNTARYNLLLSARWTCWTRVVDVVPPPLVVDVKPADRLAQ